MDLVTRPKRLTRRQALQAGGALGLGALFAPILAACGAPPAPTATPAPAATTAPTARPTDAPKPTAQAVAPTTVPAATARPAAKGEITLSLWYNKHGPDSMWREIFADFEAKNPGIKVKEQGVNINDIQQKLLTTLAGGMSLDIVTTNFSSNVTLAAKGAVLPLDDYVKQLNIDFGDFYTGAIDYLRMYKKKLWGLPYYVGQWGIYYNTKIVQEAGLEDPWTLYQKKQWTRDKYTEYAAKLTKGTGKDKIYGSDAISGSLTVQHQFIWGEGGEVWSEDGNQTLINSEAGVKAVTWASSLVSGGFAPSPADTKAFVQEGGFFGNNRMALIPSGRWSVFYWVKAPVAPNIGMVPWPVHPTGKEHTLSGVSALSITKTCEHQKEAFLVIYHMSTIGNEFLMKDGLSNPARKSLAQKDIWKKAMVPGESAENYEIWANNVKALYYPPGYSEVDSFFAKAYGTILAKEGTVKQALDQAKSKIDPILRENNV